MLNEAFRYLILALSTAGAVCFSVALTTSRPLDPHPEPVQRFCPAEGATVAKPAFLPCRRVNQAEREA